MTTARKRLESPYHGVASRICLSIKSVKSKNLFVLFVLHVVGRSSKAVAWFHTRMFRCTIRESSIVYVHLKHQDCVFDLRLCRCECTAYTSSPLIGGVYKSLAWTSATCFSRSPNHTSPRAYNNTLLLPLQRWTMVCIYRLLSAHSKLFHLCRRRCEPSLSMPAISLVQSHLGARFAE